MYIPHVGLRSNAKVNYSRGQWRVPRINYGFRVRLPWRKSRGDVAVCCWCAMGRVSIRKGNRVVTVGMMGFIGNWKWWVIADIVEGLFEISNGMVVYNFFFIM